MHGRLFAVAIPKGVVSSGSFIVSAEIHELRSPKGFEPGRSLFLRLLREQANGEYHMKSCLFRHWLNSPARRFDVNRIKY